VGAGHQRRCSLQGYPQGKFDPDGMVSKRGMGGRLGYERQRGQRRKEERREGGHGGGVDRPRQRSSGSRKDPRGKKEETERRAAFFAQSGKRDSERRQGWSRLDSGNPRGSWRASGLRSELRRSIGALWPRDHRGSRGWRHHAHGSAAGPKRRPRSCQNRSRVMQGEQSKQVTMSKTDERDQETSNPRGRNNNSEPVATSLKNRNALKRRS
jgi:hypothetical protein